MSAKQQRIGWTLLHLQLPRALDKPFLCFSPVPLRARHPFGITSQRVGLRYSIQKVRLASPRQAPKRSLANLIALLVKLTRLQMLAHERDHLPTHVVTVNRMNV